MYGTLMVTKMVRDQDNRFVQLVRHCYACQYEDTTSFMDDPCKSCTSNDIEQRKDGFKAKKEEQDKDAGSYI